MIHSVLRYSRTKKHINSVDSKSTMSDEEFCKNVCKYLFYGLIIIIGICIIGTHAENNDEFTIHKEVAKAHIRCFENQIANYPKDLSCVSNNANINWLLQHQNYIISDWYEEIRNSINIFLSHMKRNKKTWRNYKTTDSFKSLQKFLEQDAFNKAP